MRSGRRVKITDPALSLGRRDRFPSAFSARQTAAARLSRRILSRPREPGARPLENRRWSGIRSGLPVDEEKAPAAARRKRPRPL